MFTRSNVRLHLVLASVVSAVMLAACSDSSNVTAPVDHSVFSKSGTSTSGGGSTKPVDSSSTSSPTAGGAPVAPSYTARITRIGEIPAGLYYGTPSEWEVGGYLFKSAYISSFKPVNGPIVVGACVTVSFYEAAPDRIMTELKTQVSSKCP